MAGSLWWAVAAGMLIGLAPLSRHGVLPTFRGGSPPASSPQTTPSAPPAKLSIETRPPGAIVVVDGVERGATPLALSLGAGAHSLELRQGSNTRSIPLMLAPGVELVQYLELASSTSGPRPTPPAPRYTSTDGPAAPRRSPWN
jgi:hypothetical protein